MDGMKCKVCNGTGAMRTQHPSSGEDIWLDCWCTDEDLYCSPPLGTQPDVYMDAIAQIRAIIGRLP